MAKPIVALVGRPNVGKSTLFNRIVGQRIAIVEDVAGTTRDRLYYDSDWSGHEFTVVDTGGIEITPGSDLSQRVREQAELAIREADVVVFVVNVREGATSDDVAIAQVLRQSAKPVIVAPNKADNEARRLEAVEYYQLGLGEVYPISALHGTGTGDLLDAVVERLPLMEEEEEHEHPRIAVVGRPNVGKSSLVNALLGHERVVVSEIPGTTRDTVDSLIEHAGEKLVLVDTAGIRRRGRIERGLEKYSVLRTLRAINSCDIALLLIDATEGVTAQDTHLAGYIRDAHKGMAIVVNKWDIVRREGVESLAGLDPYPHPEASRAIEQTENLANRFTQVVRAEMQFAPWAPILFVSAKTGRNVHDTLAVTLRIRDERCKRIPTAALNGLLTEATAAHAPVSNKGRSPKFFYATQAEVNPPTFVFFVNDPSLIHFSYERYLENRIRKAFGFDGTPLKMVFRARGQERGEEGRD